MAMGQRRGLIWNLGAMGLRRSEHLAKAKGMLHPGDHIRLGVSLMGPEGRTGGGRATVNAHLVEHSGRVYAVSSQLFGVWSAPLVMGLIN